MDLADIENEKNHISQSTENELLVMKKNSRMQLWKCILLWNHYKVKGRILIESTGNDMRLMIK